MLTFTIGHEDFVVRVLLLPKLEVPQWWWLETLGQPTKMLEMGDDTVAGRDVPIQI